MLPYWFIFALFAIGSLSWQQKADGRISLPLIVSAIILTVFIGLRYKVGADWDGYIVIFKTTIHQSFERITNKRGDPGFYGVVWLAHQFGYEIWAVNVVCAIIFVIGLVAFSNRTANPWLSIAIAIPYLVIVVAMSGLRQATAIGFYFLALNAFSDRRLGVAALWMLLASQFHASAIVMLGVAALSFTQNRWKAFLILILTIIVGYFALKSSLDVYADRYSKDIQSSGTIFRLIMNLLPAIIFIKYRARLNLEGHQAVFWRNLSILSILSFPLLFVIPSSTALDRFSLYLIPLQCFVLANSAVIFARDRRTGRLVTAGVLAYLATAMFVFLTFSKTADKWNNYQFYPMAYTGHEGRVIKR